jgi:hypothetical protein
VVANATLAQPAGSPDTADENKISMLLMEAGVSYNKQRLHQAGYFRKLLATPGHP